MSKMKWSEAPLPNSDLGGNSSINSTSNSATPNSSNNNNNTTTATPQIKNHSVTYHRGYLYCFGGYDGRRNHQTLLIYSLREGRWITPAGGVNNNSAIIDRQQDHFTVRDEAPPGRNGHTATLATCSRSSRSRARRRRHLIAAEAAAAVNNDTNSASTTSSAVMGAGAIAGNAGKRGVTGSAAAAAMDPPSSAEEEVHAAIAELESAIVAMDKELDTTKTTANDATANKNENGNAGGNKNSQGGDDEDMTTTNRNNDPNDDDDDDDDDDAPSEEAGNQIDEDNVDDEEDEDAQIIIIGGWLGSGPLAASDMWVLDISGGLERLRWFQPPTLGTPPGPCNMHSADFIPSRGEVYVFRGGNGREYLNDLHALDVETYTWRAVQTHGIAPQQRANHSSALLESSAASELFVFGGWNGSERLNDIHVLDTATSTWSTPRVMGVKPHPRAGMTLTALRGRLYLFGGSGTSSKCFDDLQVLDRKEMAWLDVNETEEGDSESNGGNNTNGGSKRQGGQSPYYDNSWDMVSENNQNGNRDSSSWEMLGGQDGMMTESGGNDDAGIKFSDWRSYAGPTMGAHPMGAAGGGMSAVANPNDEDMVPSVYINGKPPGRRAGHTATAVGRHIYVFGGSCGTDYLNDFFVLDTDPPPSMKITEPPSPQLYATRLKHFYNDEEFSDVTFLVDGRQVFGHKLVLSTVSDCFRAMFMTGFRESGSEKTEIEIPNCSYNSFCTMMEYIYTGRGPQNINVYSDAPGHDGMDRAISLLELADQFFLYNLKQIIEGILQPAVNVETYVFLRQVAQKTNAHQLESYCRYFERNMNSLE